MRSVAHHASAARSSTLCMAIGLVVVVLQLYIISLWMQPAHTVSAPRSFTTAPPDPTLALIQRNAAADEQGRDAHSLPDTRSALSAMYLLQKFLRQNQDKLDGGARAPALPSTPGAGHTHGGHGHDHAHAKEVDVGAGIALGASSHSDHHHAGDNHDEEFLKANPKLYHDIWLNISASWAEHVLHPDRYHEMSPEEKKRVTQCMEWQNQYHVHVDSSWGKLPPALHGQFDALRCSDLVSLHATANYILKHPHLYNRVWPVPEDRQVVKPEKGFEDKVIAIIVCITTRSLRVNRPEDLALFNSLLPSFVSTVEKGFEYWFYLGYDKGDPWFDNGDNLKTVQAWWDAHVAKPLAEKEITAKLVFSTWVNPYKKPGPAFNHVTGVAYADGATWLYRINDDQRFDTPWASAFVNALTEMGPPYGVVGPVCGQGATHILVVDFVHRMHHEIFPTHYPPSLMAWWMDNWISQVYGKKRTKRVRTAKITHLVESHGTRYGGFDVVAQYMRGEIIRGRSMFEEYLSHTPGMKEVLKEYRSDTFSYHVAP